MKDILETIMLICFGFSWPVSLVKNIKARTAKSTSLFFILLIITGYLSGITAQIYTLATSKQDAEFIFKFVVYIFNLVVVTANLVVYFINRGHDKKAEGNN